MPLRKDPDTGIYYGDWYFNGKRIRRSSQTKTKRLAEEWYRIKDEELWRVHKMGQIVKYWHDAVVGYMKNRENKASFDHDLMRIDWLDSRLKGKPLNEINNDILTEIRDERLKEVSPSTTNRMMNFISAVLHYAEEREWMLRAPKIPKAEVPEPDPVWLTPDEVSRLIKELSKPRTRHLVAFVTFGIATGLRMRNITHLKWPQIDMQRKVLWVEASRSKSRKPISIPLQDDAIAVLRDQIGNHLVNVFTYRGKPYDRVGSRALNRAAKKAGITKHIHPHIFRHTFASWHIMSGTSLYDLMHLGGWQKIESVTVYAHLSAEHVAQAAANRESISHVFEDARNLLGKK